MCGLNDYSTLFDDNIWIRIAEDQFRRHIAIPMIGFGSLCKDPEGIQGYFWRLKENLDEHAMYGTTRPPKYPFRLLMMDRSKNEDQEVGEALPVPDWFREWATGVGMEIRHQRDLTFFPQWCGVRSTAGTEETP